MSLAIIFIGDKTRKSPFIFVLIVIFIVGFVSVNFKNYQLRNVYQKVAHLNEQEVEVYGKIVKTAEPRIVIAISYVMAGEEKIQVKMTIPIYTYENNNYFLDLVKCSGVLVFDKESSKVILQKCRLEKIKDSPVKFIFQFKAKLLSILRENLPTFYADFLAGLLIGVNGIKLDPELQLIFRDLGLLHMLVVSGAQVALLTNCLLAFLKIFGLPNFINFSLVSIFNAVFLLIVGGDLSVMRAVVMMQIALFLTYSNRSRQSLDVLYVSGMVLLFVDPFNLLKLSFILSFLATFAVIDVAPRVEDFIKNNIKMPSFLAETISISLGPILLTSPVILYVYHRIDFLSLLSNIVIGPFIEIIVVYGFLALILAFIIPFMAHMLLLFILGLLIMIHCIAKLFYAMPFHTYYISRVYILNIITYYFLTLFMFYFPKILLKEKRFVFIIILVVFGMNLYLIAKLPDGMVYFYSKKNAHYIVLSEVNYNLLILLGNPTEYDLKYFLSKIHIYSLNSLIFNWHIPLEQFVKDQTINNKIELSKNRDIQLIIKNDKRVLWNIKSEKGDIYLNNKKMFLSILINKKFNNIKVKESDLIYLCDNNINIDSRNNKIVVSSYLDNKKNLSANLISSNKTIIKFAYDSTRLYLNKM
ncbi:MAG: hypothetical protein A2Y15_02615 [Clostridiales bacterium GWF2_36_10]|nr:MAG: hypothetical protein A2Y15_02615 [Clostridiales bacterium GWF2_36_10]